MRTRFMAIAAIALLALTGCAADDPQLPGTPGPSGDTENVLAGDWRLIEGSDDAGAFDLKDSVVTLTLVGQTTGGRTPCNVFGADVEASPEGSGPIDITGTFQTDAGCADADLMALEPRYLAALDAVTEAAASAKSLVLTGGGVELTFEPVPEVPNEALVGTPWLLESVITGGDDGAVSSVLGKGGLLLANDGTLIGNTGCSGFTGLWQNNAGTIEISELVLEDTDCADDLVAQEKQVRAVLEGGFAAEIVGGTLTVTLESGDGLSYLSGNLAQS